MTTTHDAPDLSGLAGFRPQLIALDLDDTTLSHDDTVSERVVDAIAACTELGIHVVAATGRSITTTIPICRAAGIPTWAVVSNGAMLASVEADQPVDVISFDPTDLLLRIQELVPEASFGIENTHGIFTTNRAFEHNALAMGIREVALEDMLHQQAIRLVIRSDAHLGSGLGHLIEELGLHSVVFGIAEVAWMDIGPYGVNKATMLARLCERLDVDPARTVAIGDSMNDIEMLKWAGCGVLMGHATDEMRQYADVVTGPERGAGVAQALEEIVRLTT